MNPVLSTPLRLNESPASWNPWPWALSGILALFFTGAVSFIVFAVQQDMDLVRPDYYDQEIRYQEHLDRLERTRRLGEGLRLEERFGEGRVVFHLPAKQSGAAVTGSLRFYRPSNARLDRVVEVLPDPAGRQSIPLAGLAPGLWRVQAGWRVDGQEYGADWTLVVPGEAP